MPDSSPQLHITSFLSPATTGFTTLNTTTTTTTSTTTTPSIISTADVVIVKNEKN